MDKELLTSILEACTGEVYELREKLCLACLLVPCYVREQGSPSWPPDGLQSLAPSTYHILQASPGVQDVRNP